MPADEFDSLLSHELEQLTEVERSVVEMRFGLVDGLPLTLAEIGARFDRSRARVHQIEQRALRKLRYRKPGEPLYRYVRGRRAPTEHWNPTGVEYLLEELAGGWRRRRPHFEEAVPPSGRSDPAARYSSGRRRSLPVDSRRIIEWIAQGFSYSAILASDRRLQPEDISRAARDLLAIVDGTPAAVTTEQAAEHPRRSRHRDAATPDPRQPGPVLSFDPGEAPAQHRTSDQWPDDPRTRAMSGGRRWRTNERPRVPTARPWLDAEDEELRRLYTDGQHIAEIALALDRLFGQVQSRIVRLNLKR